jgi:hypothetical protein
MIWHGWRRTPADPAPARAKRAARTPRPSASSGRAPAKETGQIEGPALHSRTATFPPHPSPYPKPQSLPAHIPDVSTPVHAEPL